MGDCPIARSAGVSRQGREAHSSAATTFGRASPSAVAEQANSALEPTALRAAAQRPSRSAQVPLEWKGGMPWLKQQLSWAKKRVHCLSATAIRTTDKAARSPDRAGHPQGFEG